MKSSVASCRQRTRNQSTRFVKLLQTFSRREANQMVWMTQQLSAA